MAPRFIVDLNVGKLAKWLRIAGFDTVFMSGIDDSRLVRLALSENRVVLTRDRGIARRRLATTGQLKVILIVDDNVKDQLRQVVSALHLNGNLMPFTLCPACNHPLEQRTREEVMGLVPPYVFQTQTQYMQCPSCRRIYWRGTHWQRMSAELEELAAAK